MSHVRYHALQQQPLPNAGNPNFPLISVILPGIRDLKLYNNNLTHLPSSIAQVRRSTRYGERASFVIYICMNKRLYMICVSIDMYFVHDM